MSIKWSIQYPIHAMSTTQKDVAAVICAGSFFMPAHYKALIDTLQARGIIAEAPTLPSNTIIDVSATDSTNPELDDPQTDSWPNGAEDVAAVQGRIAALADRGHKVIVVGHSYGGFVATQSASPELQHATRQKSGRPGGVIGILYLAGVVLPKGVDIDTYFTPHEDAKHLPPLVQLHVSLATRTHSKVHRTL